MRWLLILALAALAGCTTLPEVNEGKRLIAEGRIDEGLAVLEGAARERRGNAAARSTFVTMREAIVSERIRQGDAARGVGDLIEAERHYLEALRYDPGSIAARNGLDGVARERRHAQFVTEAEVALKSGDIATAERKAAEVLRDNSSHRGARAVMRQISDRRAPLETERPQLKAALGKPITLEFRDANLRSVFEVISRTSGVNFVLDRDVRPDIRVTIFVRNTNLDDVLKLLLATNQLDRKVINENSVLIFPNTPAKQKEYQELVVRSFYVANADVKQTAAMIRALVKTRDIFIDEKLNLLVIKDTAEAVRLAERLVATQDLGEPEVLLEVEVLEVSSSRLRELGIRYPERINWGLLGTPGVTPPTTPGTGTTGTQLPPFIDLRNTGGVTFFITNPALIANLRQTDGAVNLLANPRIRVKNRDKARIHIGERVPVITTTSTANVGVSSSVSYLEVGLKLDVEPNVFLEDEVAMKVQLEVSNILEQLNISGTVAYRLGTRNTATTLRLRDGETQMLAGLISDDDRTSSNKVPYLGDFPVLGRLFSNPLEQRTKTEIVLLMTPRVVRNLARPDIVPAQFPSGTESSPGASPLSLRPTGPGALVLAPSGTAPAAAPTPAAPQPPARPQAAEQVPLLWVAPSQVAIGQEFNVSVGLPSGSQPRTASVELSYDPKVLALASGAPAPTPPGAPVAGQAPADPGYVTVEMVGAGIPGAAATPTIVRFRVIATEPTSTVIRVENASGQDAAGAPIAIAGPGAHTVAIVGAQGAR
jgi:general secretion pathway protein D